MAVSKILFSDSRVAHADLSGKQFHAVTLRADGKVEASTATSAIFGILQNQPKVGKAALVGILGMSKAKAGAVVASGAKLAADVNGALVPVGVAPDDYGAVALEGAAPGDVFEVFLAPFSNV